MEALFGLAGLAILGAAIVYLLSPLFRIQLRRVLAELVGLVVVVLMFVVACQTATGKH